MTIGIDFPEDRTEAGIPGGGPLQIGDIWFSSENNVLYTVVAFNELQEAVWRGNGGRRTGDRTLQDVLNSGNTANDSGDNICHFELFRNSSGVQKYTDVDPGRIGLRDETSQIGPRIVFNSSTDGTFEGRISVKDNERLTLETSNNEGIWVKDRYIDNNGAQQQRVFRIEPNEEEFAVGVYSILDPLFGLSTTETWNIGDTAADGVYTVAQAYTRENWSAAFNRALQNDPIRPLVDPADPAQGLVDPSVVLTNGPIKTVIFPAGEYNLLDPVVKTEPVTLVGEGMGVTRFTMEERVEDVAGQSKIILWRTPPTIITSDGSPHGGQFCLANKGNVRGITFKGHQAKASGGIDPPDYDDGSSDEDDLTYNNYSTVLAFRKYDNNGYAFNTQEHADNVELDDNGNVIGKQNDSADMDTKFIDCGFSSKGRGGDRNGCLKYVGRNGFISNCTFNSNYTGLVLTFPNRPGRDILSVRTGLNNNIPDSQVCSLNDSVRNEQQGGIYGWRRMQILGCVFHMNKRANCIKMYGKFQCTGMVIDGCLSDIGGQLLEFNSTGAVGGALGDNPDNGVVYSNGVGGGLKNCIISNNSFGNQTSSGAYIALNDGRFDGNVITGNSFYGNDDTYRASVCNTPTSMNGTSLKRCDNAIVVKVHQDNPGVRPQGRDPVIRGLVITNNNFSYFNDNAIDIKSENADGVIISNNYFYNIGCPKEDPTTNIIDTGNPSATAVRVEANTTCSISNNVMIQETAGMTNNLSFGQNFFKRTQSLGNNQSNNFTNTAGTGQILSNNVRTEIEYSLYPGMVDPNNFP